MLTKFLAGRLTLALSQNLPASDFNLARKEAG